MPITSIIRKQRQMTECCPKAFFVHVHSSGSQRKQYHFEWVVLPTLIYLIKILPHSHAQRPITQIALDSVRLTRNTTNQMLEMMEGKANRNLPCEASTVHSLAVVATESQPHKENEIKQNRELGVT